ncbi:hypothetical protein [Calycomorphotria hydatis]|uniref:Uncharacterized protein n=1 Tax=Calycomorphotria hydatis TaxID=2528027 RepID=A0A517TCP7_9PLAN|nr:hypothetical protein [Calycomorphotria hydatis]QDT66142.1 hypothetical protein V22_34060 [Calycomorphotria hydatis]
MSIALTQLAAALMLLTAVNGEKSEGPDLLKAATEIANYHFGSEEDQDFDLLPDGWSRRKGEVFPQYVEIGIDRERGRTEPGCLTITPNGGPAVLYSQPIRIDSLRTHLFEGFIRTDRLRKNAALFSISVLDHQRNRIARYTSRPVSGTHRDWVRLRIGPIRPIENQRFIVIGCHLIGSPDHDMGGFASFDDLRLGRMPQVQLVSNFKTHYRQRHAPVEVRAWANGLETGHNYTMNLELLHPEFGIVSQKLFELEPVLKSSQAEEENADSVEASMATTREINWTLSALEYGYYKIRATLIDNEQPVLRENVSFAVMDLTEPTERGDFGWTVESPIDLSPTEFSSIASQAGVNWVKYPVWKDAVDHPDEAVKAVQLSEHFNALGVNTIGLLNEPPRELREKFAREWKGASEVFTLPPKVWRPTLEPVVARFTSTIRHWQVGSDDDPGFSGMTGLEEMVTVLKDEFERVGRDARLGVPWEPSTPFPRIATRTPVSLAMNFDQRHPEKVTIPDENILNTSLRRWYVLTALPSDQYTDDERAADLVRRIVAAKIAPSNVVFINKVFDSNYGLLNEDGSPTPLFIPWRTASIALRNTKYLGSISLSGGSTNHIFTREGEASMVLWNPEPTTEKVYLGEFVKQTDIRGVQRDAVRDPETGQQVLDIGPDPLILTGCSQAVALWRTAVKFETGRLQSKHGQQRDAIIGRNTLTQGVSGTVTLVMPREWEAEQTTWELTLGPGEEYRLPLSISLPPNTSLGDTLLTLKFDVFGDHNYHFAIRRPMRVGFGDLQIDVEERLLENGQLEVEQHINNRTSPLEILNFRCSLFVPGEQRRIRLITKLGAGTDTKIYYIPNGKALLGKELWLRAEQEGGRRVLNYRWKVGEKME